MIGTRSSRFGMLLLLAVALAFAAIGRTGVVAERPDLAGEVSPIASGAARPDLAGTPAPQAAGPAVSEIGLAAVKPNELGMVPILMYHEIGPAEHDWSRTPAGFRSDLERLYRGGFRLVSLGDFLEGGILLPAGLSPVVLTFDDGLAGQFRYIEGEDGEWQIDPNCAVGILLDFQAEHPDFGLAATFFIYYGNPFRQPALVEAKLRHLVELGFEIGNHSYSHPYFTDLPGPEIQRELAWMADRTTEIVPGCRIRAVAVPFGQLPPVASRPLLLAGRLGELAYRNRGVLLAGGSPSPAPSSRDFDRLAVPRIRATQFQLDRWLGRLETREGMRYVSDGDPGVVTFPASAADRLGPERVGPRATRSY
jgi:peptidoglycan/xylan/chitin deacetylase (PgdA/CDA1 family)